MYKKAVLMISLLTMVAFGIVIGADNAKTAAPAPTSKKLHDQEICPVMGEKINKKFFADVQGQRVYFCCARCDGKFRANADSLFKKAAVDGVLFENVQKVCPVTGDPINKKIYTDWEGRRVYFCCNMCPPIFAKDPMKYLKRLDMPADSVKWDKM